MRYGAAIAQRLVAELMTDLAQRYGDGDATPTDPGEFDPPGGCFLVAYLHGEPVGCAGWRSWAGAEDVAEAKRVYTNVSVRGRGVGRSLMAALEADAKAQGKVRMILETGTGQPEAMALYQAIGYELIENFGHYKDYETSRSYGKDL